MIEVTQADRNAAKSMDRQNLLGCYFEEHIDRGDYDHVPAIQQFATHRIEAAKAERDRLQQKIEALEAALRRMIYETTHLSPMKPNGDHDCTIKADALEQARQALESQP